MDTKILSLRPFIGAKNFDVSRSFYRDLGFEESELGPQMSVFRMQDFSFYLQRAYVKDWVDNTMLFMEVADTAKFYEALSALNLPEKYIGVKLTPIRNEPWGRECFLHDPSGVLWHFGEFF
ncbi:VOC family protein [Flavobacterium pallidum]|uniref:Glyoxalase n=1 Tax=Flavobacterium pallidum TaxID=2172098 RepID=A0A2S1SKQ4_9FLAO|nr:glyoxalase [Flavobacterium pallidum]